MDALIFNSPGEFVYPAEILVGRIAALHPEDEFERHCREVKQAKTECQAFNEKFVPKINQPKTQNQNTETPKHYDT
jgi:hypothetical protein